MILAATTAGAGTIGITPITSDADTGIDSNLTYTHAIDFGSGGTAVVNGVTFGVVTAPGAFPAPTGTSQTVGTGSHDIPGVNGGWEGATNVTGNFRQVQKDMVAGGSGTNVVTLTGLTPGETYKIRFYHMAWGFGGGDRRIAVCLPRREHLAEVAFGGIGFEKVRICCRRSGGSFGVFSMPNSRRR